MACTGCGASPADFFSPDGDSVCQRCFYAGEQTRMEAEARASLEASLPPGLKYDDKPTTPKGIIWAGLGIILLGLAMTAGLLLLTGDLYFWPLLIAGAGFAAVARGIALSRGS
jgi:hypothetical protein